MNTQSGAQPNIQLKIQRPEITSTVARESQLVTTSVLQSTPSVEPDEYDITATAPNTPNTPNTSATFDKDSLFYNTSLQVSKKKTEP